MEQTIKVKVEDGSKWQWVKKEKRVKIRWKLLQPHLHWEISFHFLSPAMTIMKEKEWQEEWYERKKEKQMILFPSMEINNKQSFEKEES